MRLLTCAFRSRNEFLANYSAAPASGALYFRSRAELRPRERVLIEVSFPRLPNRALLRGTVLEIQPGKGSWLVLDEADSSTRDFLLALARGEIEISEHMERAHSRFPTQLHVDCTAESSYGPESGEAIDVSASGMFIRHQAPPPVGTRVRMVIGPIDATPATITVEGRVAWIYAEPSEPGFGVQFQHTATDDVRRLRTLLRRTSETGRLRLRQRSHGSTSG